MRISKTDAPVHTVPAGRLWKIEELESISDEDWQRVASVPGAFFLDRVGPLPASGNIAWGERASKGRWPEPVYVPDAQTVALSKTFPLEMQPILAVLPPAPVDGSELPQVPYGPEQLLSFQVEAVRELLQKKRMPLLIPVGAGKTLPAIYIGEELFRRGLIDRVVVIAPSTILSSVWRKKLGNHYHVVPTLIEGSPAKRAKLLSASEPLTTDPAWFLTKYDTYRTDATLLRRIVGPRTLVVIDEVHHLKAATTKRWRAIRDLLDEAQVDYRLFLTGTLLYDKPLDAFGPISLLGLRVWNTYTEFRDRYFRVIRFGTGQFDKWGKAVIVEVPDELKGPEEAAELRDVIDRVSFRRTRKQVGLVLPPLRQEERVIEATKAEEELYDRILEPLTEGGAVSENGILATIAMERLFSSDPILLVRSKSETATGIVQRIGRSTFEKVSPGSKIRALIDFLGDFLEEDPEPKVVVFSQWEEIYEVLRGWLDVAAKFGDYKQAAEALLTGGMGKPFGDEEIETLARISRASLFFYGGLSTGERDATLAKFLHDPATRILFSTDMGGEGLDEMQGVVTHIVHYEDAISLGKYEQRIGRAWRRGQQNSVLSIRFELSPERRLGEALSKMNRQFVDARLRDLIDWKLGQRELVLGDE